MTIIRLRMGNDDSSPSVSEMTIDPSPSLFDAPIAAPVSAVDGDDRTPLLPVRHPNQDLFICDVLAAIPKDAMDPMEHSVFSFTNKPDNRTNDKASGRERVGHEVYTPAGARPI